MDLLSKITTVFLLCFFAPDVFLCQNPCGPPGNVIVPAESQRRMREGEVVDYYPNGAVHTKAHYLHNVENGTFTWYNPNGSLIALRTYSFGVMAGPFEDYYNEVLKLKGNYFAGNMSGAFISYYPDGTKEEEGTFNYDQKDGPSKHFYKDGQVEYTLNYKAGQLLNDGSLIVYYPSGKIKKEENYKKGKRTGNWRLYYETGKLKEEGSFKNKNEQGTLIEYHPNGNVMSIVHFTMIPDVDFPMMKNLNLQGEKLYFDEQEEPIKKENYYQGYLLKSVDLSGKNEKKSWQLVFPKTPGYAIFDSVKNLLHHLENISEECIVIQK